MVSVTTARVATLRVAATAATERAALRERNAARDEPVVLMPAALALTRTAVAAVETMAAILLGGVVTKLVT